MHDWRSLLLFFFFVFLCYFCVCRCRFRLEITARCHLHALPVASCCLPDPLNAPLCWYVDMAPSAVGRCPLLRCRRGKTPRNSIGDRLSQIIILVQRHTAVGKPHSHSGDGAAGAFKWVEFSVWLPSHPQSEGQPEGQGVPQSFQGSRHQRESPVTGARRRD